MYGAKYTLTHDQKKKRIIIIMMMIITIGKDVEVIHIIIKVRGELAGISYMLCIYL